MNTSSQASTPTQIDWISVAPFVLAMIVVIVSSNILVQMPFDVFPGLQEENWLTWAAFTYPIAFLVTDLSNRHFGPQTARKVVYVGFALAVLFSALFGDLRIALASGSAFLLAQLLDVSLFSRLRDRLSWWAVPMVSSAIASLLDTVLFFGLAFAGTDVPWVQLAAGDYVAKIIMVVVLLLPYRMLMPRPALAA